MKSQRAKAIRDFERLSNDSLIYEDPILYISLTHSHFLAVTSRGKVFTWGVTDQRDLFTHDVTSKHRVSQIVTARDGWSYAVMEDTGRVVKWHDVNKDTGNVPECQAFKEIEVKMLAAGGELMIACSEKGEAF